MKRRRFSLIANILSVGFPHVATYPRAFLAAVIAAVTTLGADVAAAQAVSPPVNTAAPTISGTERVGEQLTGQTGTWSSTETPTLFRQWQRCQPGGSSCSDILGQTASRYLISSADRGKSLRLKVTATNQGGSTVAYSAATPRVFGRIDQEIQALSPFAWYRGGPPDTTASGLTSALQDSTSNAYHVPWQTPGSWSRGLFDNAVVGAGPAFGNPGGGGWRTWDFNTGCGWSMSTWVNPNGSTQTSQAILDRDAVGSSNNRLWVLQRRSDNTLRFTVWDATSGKDYALYDQLRGPTTHVGVTFSCGTVRLYTNGVLRSTVTIPGGTAGTGSDILISASSRATGSENFNGWQDELAFFSKTLSNEDMSAVYKAGSTVPSSTNGLPPQGQYEFCALAGVVSMCSDRLRSIAQGGFRLVVNARQLTGSAAEQRAYMSAANAADLQVMWGLHRGFWQSPLSASDMLSKYPQLAADCGCQTNDGLLQFIVRLAKESPATWGYYVADEPPPSEKSKVQALAQRVRQLDPGHPTIMVGIEPGNLGGANIYPFAGVTNVIAADPYPVCNQPPGTVDIDATVGSSSRIVAAAAAGGPAAPPTTPAMVLQGWSWGDADFGSGICGTATQRFPTQSELRAMRDSAITNAHPALIMWFNYPSVSAWPPGQIMNGWSNPTDAAARWASLTSAAFSPTPGG